MVLNVNSDYPLNREREREREKENNFVRRFPGYARSSFW
jgi:hypothetical protein